MHFERQNFMIDLLQT